MSNTTSLVIRSGRRPFGNLGPTSWTATVFDPVRIGGERSVLRTTDRSSSNELGHTGWDLDIGDHAMLRPYLPT